MRVKGQCEAQDEETFANLKFIKICSDYLKDLTYLNSYLYIKSPQNRKYICKAKERY